MPDLIAISQGLTAVKATTDIIKTMVGLHDSSLLLERTVELNRKLLEVQTALGSALQEQTTLVQTIREREEEIAGLKTWEIEKHRYQLAEVAPRTYAYVLKSVYSVEPPHWICPVCYQTGRKSILQGFNSHTFGWSHKCAVCGLEIQAGP